MSASLVGSEMCIRDRGRAAWALGGRLSTRAPWLAASFARPKAPGGRRSPCLLYTSDAADDM
eukprot:12500054-Alexandrium_andersonii.AAC.1